MRAIFDHAKPSRAVDESHVDAVDEWMDVRERYVQLVRRRNRMSGWKAQGDHLT